MKPRVRFAPSPTGPLHIGGVRTALYNYLFAKQQGGTFILRIEDTDQTRFVPGAEEYIIEAFQWLGLEFDEGVHKGGDYAPYKQSQRQPIYKQYADYLLDRGFAYIAFDSAEELDAKRKACELQKKTFQYDVNTRLSCKNSLTISKEETAELMTKQPYVIRFKFPADTEILVNDLIRGEVRVNSNSLDDKVLFKSDGMPTYHLANVVDDYLMKITHVIRGEEWLPSAPLHVMLYRALGWEEAMPRFAHLPLLLKPDGNGKLSKRDGDRLGFPVFPLQWNDPKTGEISSGYREKGYLPEAIINFLALLGWNFGTEQELFTLQELIEAFKIEKISKAGAKFDIEKAKWFNHIYLQQKDTDFLISSFQITLKEKGLCFENEYVGKVVELVRNRINLISDLWEQALFFFEPPVSYDEKVVAKRWNEQTPQNLLQIVSILEKTTFEKTVLHDAVMQFIADNSINTGQIMNCLRLCLVGEAKGPDLFEIISLIGKEETIFRIKKAVETI
ncbi:MAG: glutamate--tRNA ligase [Lentimicrobiaceae bacterium]|nr:glutamate--tRNA ligase [Lentimicrobiaceae bacterium]